MSTVRVGTNVGSQHANQKGPASENAVVFRGDGEPATPAQVLRQLELAQSDGMLTPDSYSLGGSVEVLEKQFAEALGKESSIFMPTGTLANHLAIRALCGDTARAIVQEQSHLYHDTGDCVTRLSGINLIPLGKGRPCFSLDEVRDAVADSNSGRVENSVGALMIESPVRRQMGQIMPYDEMKRVTDYCKEHGIGTHLDGARLYMMASATGTSPKEYASLFDTAYISLYKYFGAPFGAILAGNLQVIEGMYHTRRMFGGGLASSYLAAGLALKGMDGFEERFTQAMSKAKDLFRSLNTLQNIEVGSFEHGSNIFPLRLNPEVDKEIFAESLRQEGVFVYPEEGSDSLSRLTVNTTVLRKSNDELFEAFSAALVRGSA